MAFQFAVVFCEAALLFLAQGLVAEDQHVMRQQGMVYRILHRPVDRLRQVRSVDLSTERLADAANREGADRAFSLLPYSLHVVLA